MSSDFDDNLIKGKRKNTSAAQYTNLLVVVGFIVIALLTVFLLGDDGSVDSLAPADIDATVNARVNELSTQQALANTDVPSPTRGASTIPLPTDYHTIINGTELSSGKSVNETINDKNFEIHYTFTGHANIAFLITLQGHSLELPELILTNPYGNKLIATATAHQPIGTPKTRVIGVIIPSDGQYTITVTRKGGRTGDSEGEFTLSLDIPSSLNARSDTDGVAVSNGWRWYTYRNDDPFYVIYNHEGGDYRPDVGIYTLNTRSEFVRQAYLVGSEVSHNEIGSFDPRTIHFIAVGQSTIQSTDETTIETSSFSIGIDPAR